MRVNARRVLVSLVALSITLGAATLAMQPSRVIAQEESTATPSFTIDDLAFIAGHWEGELFGGRSEEVWIRPDAGTMLGVFRLKHGEQTRVIEFLMITQTETGVRFYFKHYNRDYSTWEKDAPLTFDLVELTGTRAVFTSDVQDSPNRLVYHVREDGSLGVLVEGVENGKTEAFEAVFSRSGN